MVWFSWLITASVLLFPAAPVVTPVCELMPPPEDCAVPAELVPGAGELNVPPAPADGPPAPPPALPPPPVPPLWASEIPDEVRMAIAAITAVKDALVIENLPFLSNPDGHGLFLRGTISAHCD